MVKYKEEYYYWEYIIFIRRVSIAFYSVSVDDDSLTWIFIAVLIVFLSVQFQCKPFVIEVANDLESILLGCLLAIVAGQALSMDEILRV